MNNKDIAKKTIEITRSHMKINPAELAVESILADIGDRRDIKHFFNNIDDDVINDIKEVWAEIIKICYSKEQ